MPQATRFKPKGQSIRWSNTEIGRMSVITDEDITEAIKLWRKLMPGRFKSMLQAKPARKDAVSV